MSKLILRILAATTAIVTSTLICTDTEAEPKFLKTGKTLKKDEYLTLQVINRTQNEVQVEIPSYTDQISMQPKQRRKFRFKLRNREHGLSVLYWSPTGEFALSGRVKKPTSQTVLLDVYPSTFAEDDKAIYDTEIPGTVLIF